MRAMWVLAFMLSLSEAARPKPSSMVVLEGDAARHGVHHGVNGPGCEKRNAQRNSSWAKKVFSSKSTCKCNEGVANAYCAEADIGKKEFSLTRETSSECKCEIDDACWIRNARISGLDKFENKKCKCRNGDRTNAFCPEVGKEEFSLTRETSSRCECEHECTRRNARISGLGKCQCRNGDRTNAFCPEVGKGEFSLTRETSSQCKCEHECTRRNALILGSHRCKCRDGEGADEHCAESDIGTEILHLTKETSSQCKCKPKMCEIRYGAYYQTWQNGQLMCECEQELFPHALCGVPWGSRADFPLEPAKEGCRCLDVKELQQLRPAAPVRVAALNLCKAFWEKSSYRAYPDLTPKMCEQVVAEGLAPSGQKWLKELNDTSKEQHHGYGRLDPLVPVVPGTAVHHHLQHVCEDECKSLVKKMTDRRVQLKMRKDIHKGAPFEGACADRVVRQVEADVLGCCAKSCGYNGKSCLAWPFFTKAEKVVWLEECCTEFNVLSGSPREAMCNSVLTPDQAKKVSATDVKPLEKGADVGEPYIGQGPMLLWTETGVQSELGKFYSRSQHPPEANGPVASQVMEEHPKIRAEGLQKGWFTEKDVTKSDSESRGASLLSLMEASRETCDLRNVDQCTETFKKLKETACMKQRKWKVSQKVDKQDAEHGGEGCPKGSVRHVETPEDCFTAFQNEAEVKSYFFEFHIQDKNPLDKDSPSTPIACYVETKQSQCDEGHPKKKISIEDLNKEDLRSLADITFWLDAKDLPEDQ